MKKLTPPLFRTSTVLKAFSISLMSILLFLGCAGTKNTNNSNSSISLFQNENENWTETGNANWQLKNGTLKGMAGEGYVGTSDDYDNFELIAEFRPEQAMNSGIFVRCPGNEGSAVDCYEINIWDDHVNQDFRTGAIVTHGKPLAHVNSVGKWNTYKIRAENNRIQVWLNGTKTADLMDNKSSKGKILLQVNGIGAIEFRNVKLVELE